MLPKESAVAMMRDRRSMSLLSTATTMTGLQSVKRRRWSNFCTYRACAQGVRRKICESPHDVVDERQSRKAAAPEKLPIDLAPPEQLPKDLAPFGYYESGIFIGVLRTDGQPGVGNIGSI